MTITLHPRGPFSLTAAATFVEGFPGTSPLGRTVKAPLTRGFCHPTATGDAGPRVAARRSRARQNEGMLSTGSSIELTVPDGQHIWEIAHNLG